MNSKYKLTRFVLVNFADIIDMTSLTGVIAIYLRKQFPVDIVVMNARKQRCKMKLRVEYNVPNDGCKCCRYFNPEVSYCILFGQYVKYNVIRNDYTHCEDCRQAEIEETRYQELDKLKTQVTRLQSKVDKLECKVNKKDL